jgi:hypothetical protein
LLQVFEHGGGLQQAAVVEDDGVFKQGAQAFVALLFLLTLRCEWLQRHPGAQGQTAQRLPEVYVLLFHHEFENVSPLRYTDRSSARCLFPARRRKPACGCSSGKGKSQYRFCPISAASRRSRR